MCSYPLVFLSCFRENLQELEVVSQTDLKCVWSKQKNVVKDKYQAIPLIEMPCLKKKKTQKNENINVDGEKIYKFFVSRLPDSGLAKHE